MMDFIDRTGRYVRCEKEDYKWGLNRHELSLTLCFKATNGGGGMHASICYPVGAG